MKRAFLALALVALLAAPARAGHDEGVAAYKRGDYAAALRVFRPLAEQGDAPAQYYLGVMYRDGRVAEAEQGHAAAQLNLDSPHPRLDRHLKKIERRSRDEAEAVKWFRLAAEQDSAWAQYALAGMYSDGRGVERNKAEAAKWFRLAAEQGHARAQVVLGNWYEHGLGVAQDLVQAHKWFDIAASQNSVASKETRDSAVQRRDLVASKMTPAEIDRAKKLARDFKPTR